MSGGGNAIEYCGFEDKADLAIVIGIEPDCDETQPNRHVIGKDYSAQKPFPTPTTGKSSGSPAAKPI
jgi:hypothetical protein